MKDKKNTVTKTLLVAFLLCIICSIIVSVSSVLLRNMQKQNKDLEIKKNILTIAGFNISDNNKIEINKLFENIIKTRLVNIVEGKFVKIIPAELEEKSLKKMGSLKLNKKADIANIKIRENYSLIYLIMNKYDKIDKILVPIRGYGLWSTLYGFIALQNDFNTIAGLGFYKHGETPGLGGEVDNPKWKALWKGKKVYDEKGNVVISLKKTIVRPKDPNYKYQVNSLSGATLTSRGVNNLIKFWLGKKGFLKLFNNLKKENS